MIDAVQKDEIEELNETLRVVFPGLDMTTMQKVQTWKVQSYQDFLKSHHHAQHYTFQIQKCKDESRCSPSTVTGDLK